MYNTATVSYIRYQKLSERKYKKNHFTLTPSKEWANMFLLCFHEEFIGYICTADMNVMRNGKVKTIFFWITQAEICNGHLSVLKNNIGKVLLTFNENTKEWKLNQVTFTEIPGKLLPLTRKILIEKN